MYKSIKRSIRLYTVEEKRHCVTEFKKKDTEFNRHKKKFRDCISSVKIRECRENLTVLENRQRAWDVRHMDSNRIKNGKRQVGLFNRS